MSQFSKRVEKLSNRFKEIDRLTEFLHVNRRQEQQYMSVSNTPKLIDIRDMPKFNPAVKNGLTSVSEGKIFWTPHNKVTCKEHGACLCLNMDRTIWRCPACNEGAYVIWESLGCFGDANMSDACATCPDNTPCANETIKIYKEEDKMI